MDIRLVLSRSILYFLLILVVALAFTFITFSTAQLLHGKGEVIVTLAVSLIIVIGFDPLKKFLARATDAFFYKDKIDFQKVLRLVGEVIAKELDMRKLLDVLINELEKNLKLSKVHILVAKKEVFAGYGGINEDRFFEIANDGPIIGYLKKFKGMVVAEELPRLKSETDDRAAAKLFEDLEKRLEDLHISLIVPIMVEDELSSLFLVENKLSGDAFTQEELNFFEILAPQVATALEKSKLFEEVQAAKTNLETLVDQRTRDLKERNLYLLALQKLTNVITRSLDFQKVMQTIADGISSELGYIGGILSFIDFEKRVIRIKAISNTTAIQKIISKIPQQPGQYEVSLDNEENSSIRAINTRQMIATNDFYETVAPALPHPIATLVQKIAGIKAVMSVPVYSEEKVIGVMDFIIQKPSGEITDVEKEMMKSLADQVGIVYRNLDLYQKIQEANTELKDANIRLQQLDKAKSEFLSIASHQLRTPLTGIKGYLSMILEGDFGQVPAKQYKILSDLFDNSDRLTRLINVFLNVSRIESGKFELSKKDMDLVQLVEEVMHDLKTTSEKKGLNLIFNKPAKLLPHYLFDRDKIKDILVNLVDNAIKYTVKGKVEIILNADDREVRLSVKDTGIGISPEDASNLFRKFARGDGIAQVDTSGSGLGLFIAKKIVEAHGGKIWVESLGKDKGAEFIFTLPIHA